MCIRDSVVYLVPAIIGFVMSLFALLFAKETYAFLIKRIEYLKTPIEGREQRSKEGREPVSYTHLDVYKRQFYCRELSGKKSRPGQTDAGGGTYHREPQLPSSGYEPCLLYTSRCV